MRRLSCLLVVLALAGCATAYQTENRFSGGFSEVQLDANVFRVSFQGNGYTSPERAEEMALLRNADVTLKNGFTHFVIVDGRSRVANSTYVTPVQSTTAGTVSAYGGSAASVRATTTTTGGQVIAIAKPSTTNTFMCFERRPNVEALVYDARFVFNSLAATYGGMQGTP